MADGETDQNSISIDEFMKEIKDKSEERIQLIHHLSKKIWGHAQWSPIELQNKCMDAWDKIGIDLDTKILPVIPVQENQPVTNLIFGSGGFSTGEFQVQQYELVNQYTDNPPVVCQGLVTNKSEAHQCNAANVSKKYNIPLAELDFVDWFHEFHNPKESNPVQATRYWFPKEDPNRPSKNEIEKRFKIRQVEFHKSLGEKIAEISPYATNTVSARGYNFQFCRELFRKQLHAPLVDDTHPADLTYVDPNNRQRLYPGWQSGAIELMMQDNHTQFRGSLIGVEYMDKVSQIDSLDEGALYAIGEGITPNPDLPMTAKQIQDAMKIMDDYCFCTLEPTGLFLTWGITEKPLIVTYQDLEGHSVQIKQPVIFVGDKIRSGVNAWGKNLSQDVQELEDFLFH
jgi:hypothetical protein